MLKVSWQDPAGLLAVLAVIHVYLVLHICNVVSNDYVHLLYMYCTLVHLGSGKRCFEHH